MGNSFYFTLRTIPLVSGRKWSRWSQGFDFQVWNDGGSWLGDKWVYPDVFGPKQTGPVMHIPNVTYILNPPWCPASHPCSLFFPSLWLHLYLTCIQSYPALELHTVLPLGRREQLLKAALTELLGRLTVFPQGRGLVGRRNGRFSISILYFKTRSCGPKWKQ